MPKKSTTPEISPISSKLIEDFSQAAQSWGWEADQGNGSGVDAAEKEFNRSKASLTDRIRFLEGRVRKLKTRVPFRH